MCEHLSDLAVLVYIGAVTLTAGCADERPEPVPVARVLPPLEAGVEAVNPDYARHRDEAVALGRAAMPVLEGLAESAKAWRIRVLAAICLERIRKPTVVRALLRSEPRPRGHRGHLERIWAAGKDLAKRGRRTPMVIAEAMWKGNGLAVAGSKLERMGVMAHALRILDEQRGRPVLELVLVSHKQKVPPGGKPDTSRDVRETIAGALGAFGSPESAAALLWSAENDREARPQGRSRAASRRRPHGS